ncbi:unnamed protein product [Adineta steineri]|uniref:Protein kinase domain-containing protein n=1 Tax=Adineta steineri TaxID=433720 RepID=A0A814X6A4_9BILA|nr:unnamed protein product [Adineta steineri]CAF1219883.1 unnamed protein product [Adineta steineri]
MEETSDMNASQSDDESSDYKRKLGIVDITYGNHKIDMSSCSQSFGNVKSFKTPPGIETEAVSNIHNSESATTDKTYNDIKVQANRDLPNDVPVDWTSINTQVGNAGGQGEVRKIFYKNDSTKAAVIKIYSHDIKTKKTNEAQNDYLKERKMRAHRELVALKALQGVKNVTELTQYTNDYSNIPNEMEDAITADKTFWIIMNYINGETLETFMEKYKDINLLNAVKLTQKLLFIIKGIHSRGVIHRDIKPSNLLFICKPNVSIEKGEIHVIDFGLSYIETREDDVGCSSFKEKEIYRRTHLGNTIGNIFFRVPQLNAPVFKDKTHKERNVLIHVRRSPTIDASSVCAILFWLLTGIEPGPKHRNNEKKAPHQVENASTIIMLKINEAAKQTGVAQELVSGLTNQLKNYVMTTFDKGFEYAEYQWTVEQLEYRLKAIIYILEQTPIPFHQQLSNATKSLLALEPTTLRSNQNSINMIFNKASVAFESAKANFIDQHPSCSWNDGHCHWLEYRQDMCERKNFDLLSYQRNIQNWRLILICSAHINQNGKITTLTIATDSNGVYIELPLGQYTQEELDNLNIQLEFEKELISLLQVICKPGHTSNTGSVPLTN